MSLIGDGADITIPFIPRYIWLKLKDRIFFTDGLSKNIIIYDLSGKNIGMIQIACVHLLKMVQERIYL